MTKYTITVLSLVGTILPEIVSKFLNYSLFFNQTASRGPKINYPNPKIYGKFTIIFFVQDTKVHSTIGRIFNLVPSSRFCWDI